MEIIRLPKQQRIHKSLALLAVFWGKKRVYFCVSHPVFLINFAKKLETRALFFILFHIPTRSFWAENQS